jgi:hypothetical protein
MTAALQQAEQHARRALEDAAKLFLAQHHCKPVWRRRLRWWESKLFGRHIVELTRDLELQIRCPETGEIVARSVRGEPEQLADRWEGKCFALPAD